MRRLVAVVLVALLAFVLVGCSKAASSTAGGTTTVTAPVATATPVVTTLPTDRSNALGPVFEPFPKTIEAPSVIASALAESQPLVLFFYDPAQAETSDARKAIDAAMKKNGGLAELVTYDVGKYTSVNASGQAIVDSAKIIADKTASEAGRIAPVLKVVYTPFVVVIDDQGYIIYRQRGPFDQTMLEAQLERVTD